MTNGHDAPPSVRLMCDGGREPKTVQKTAVADSVVTREVDGDEQEMIRVPISSTRPDRENDEFDRDALDAMADQIRAENPMVFDNHGLAGSWMEAIPYDSRETIGAQMDAEVEVAEDSEADLYALVNPDGTHVEGERMLRQVRDEGQPIKFSVGFKIINYDEKTDDGGNEIGRIFTNADLMETSRVGIPANPDASVTQSMAAKGGGGGLPGYANHPMMQMLAAMRGGETATVTKDAVDSETVQEATPVHVDGQGKAATDGGEKEDKPKCDSDADCPDGEVCVDGHCVPEDEANASTDDGTTKATCPECGEDVADDANYCPNCGEELGDDEGDDDDDEEESSVDRDTEDVPEIVKEIRERNRELRKEISDIRDSLDRGDAKTGDTDMTPDVADSEDADDDTDEKTTSNGLLFD